MLVLALPLIPLSAAVRGAVGSYARPAMPSVRFGGGNKAPSGIRSARPIGIPRPTIKRPVSPRPQPRPNISRPNRPIINRPTMPRPTINRPNKPIVPRPNRPSRPTINRPNKPIVPRPNRPSRPIVDRPIRPNRPIIKHHYGPIFITWPHRVHRPIFTNFIRPYGSIIYPAYWCAPILFAPAYWENGVYIYQTISAEEAQRQAESLRDWLIDRIAEQLKKMPIKESYSVDVSVENYRKVGSMYESDVKVVITGIDSKKEYIIPMSQSNKTPGGLKNALEKKVLISPVFKDL